MEAQTGINDPLDGPTSGSALLYRCSSSRVPSYSGYPGSVTSGTVPNFCSHTDVTETDPTLGVLSFTQHYYYGSAINLAGLFASISDLGYSAWMEGKEFRTVTSASAGSPVLQDVRVGWTQRADPPWWNSTSLIPPSAGDPRQGWADRVVENGKMARQVTSYSNDVFNNVTDSWQYDFGNTSGTQGALLRHTNTVYNQVAAYTAAPVHLVSLPASTTTDGGGQTQFCYDEGSTTAGNNVSFSCGSAGAARGNVTSQGRWRNTDGHWLVSTSGYDVYGNVSASTNARNTPTMNTTTTYTYTSLCSYGFVNQITNPIGQQMSYNYTANDCVVGKPSSITDPNGGTTTLVFNDPLDRLTHVSFADSSNTCYAYTIGTGPNAPDGPITVSTVRDLDGTIQSLGCGSQATRNTTTRSTTDGLGRVIQTMDSAGVTTAKTLDALGRVAKQFNPGDSVNGTTYTYDALGRMLTGTYADGSQETTTYAGDLSTHVDPAGASTRQTVDGLGRILQVTEDPTGLNLATTYTYDATDDLTGVTQTGLATSLCSTGQSRCFVYDSLKELVSATNPESGTTTYTYDENGNLSTKVAGPVTTTYTYDSLDRIQLRSYQVASVTAPAVAPAATPAVTWCYDGQVAAGMDGTCMAGPGVPYAVGHLTEVRNSVSTTDITAYDKLGRITASKQTTPGAPDSPYGFTYGWNAAGELTSTLYPSGRTVMNSYDSGGRVCSVSGTARGGTAPTPSCVIGGTSQVTPYANSVGYTLQESLSSLARGDQQTETWTYNSRLQAQSIAVGASVFGATIYYCTPPATGCTNNNGNIQAIALATPGVTQSFTYDNLNRLKSITEGSLSENWGYDNRGNRYYTGTPGFPVSPFLATGANAYNNLNQTTMVGALHNDRGNQTSIGSYGFTYDGESRMATGQISGATTTYSYDGDGRRVAKQTGTASPTYYVYDAFGNLAAEYGGTATSPCTTCYVSVDQLGSTRVLTDSTGNVKERHDYRPFGEEMFAGGPRTTVMGYQAGPSSEVAGPKFTGQYRDPEMGGTSAMTDGLDYFGARYFSAAQGRFTSPDPKSAGVDISNPQSWNGYSYTLNNPLRYIDQNGKWPTDIHNAILSAAFDHLSASQVGVLEAASASVDSFGGGGQTAALAYQHGMRSPYETAAKARSDADAFISSNEQAAGAEAARAGSIDDAALNDIGTALHTVMDRTSPAHAGEQVWTGGGEPGATSAAGPIGCVIGAGIDAIRAKIHSDKEKQITLDQYHGAIDAVRTHYLKTFGRDAFQRATGCKQVEGCGYDDSQLRDDLRKVQ